MNFKEIMEWDAKKIHLNTDEQTDSITWEGDHLDAEVIHEGEGYDAERSGVSVEIVTLHILASSIKRPQLFRSYEYNGKKWTVSRVQPAGPILKIQIFRENS